MVQLFLCLRFDISMVMVFTVIEVLKSIIRYIIIFFSILSFINELYKETLHAFKAIDTYRHIKLRIPNPLYIQKLMYVNAHVNPYFKKVGG
jgi:hypothetical protein